MCVFKYHAFIFCMRPPRWRSETLPFSSLSYPPHPFLSLFYFPFPSSFIYISSQRSFPPPALFLPPFTMPYFPLPALSMPFILYFFLPSLLCFLPFSPCIFPSPVTISFNSFSSLSFHFVSCSFAPLLFSTFQLLPFSFASFPLSSLSPSFSPKIESPHGSFVSGIQQKGDREPTGRGEGDWGGVGGGRGRGGIVGGWGRGMGWARRRRRGGPLLWLDHDSSTHASPFGARGHARAVDNTLL